MRNYLMLLIILLLLIVAVVLSRAAEQAVAVYGARAERPYSAVDVVMKSRQTPPIATAGERHQAGWLALGLLGTAVGVALLHTSSNFLRQLRLWQRSRSSRARSPRPDGRPAPTPPPLPGVPAVRPADSVPTLPPVTAEQREYGDGIG